MKLLQLKPYLEVRRIGENLRIGHMPPRGIELESAPGELDRLMTVLSRPTDMTVAAQALAEEGEVPAEGWVEVIEQLVESGVVGEVVPDGGRYARHYLYFDLIGIEPHAAQQQLRERTVAVVGTGGIGSNVATMLAAAGVGRLILTDGDTVELSNLTRQVLYDEGTVGDYKVDAAAKRLQQINSEVEVVTLRTAATEELLLRQLEGCDVVVLSADSPDELYRWVDEGARAQGYAYLAAGYIESFGGVGPLVIPGHTACYDCMAQQGELTRDFDGAGRIGANLNSGMQAPSYGPLNMMVASIAANEAIRLLLGAECETAGRRMLVDSQSYGITTEDFERIPTCGSCGDIPARDDWTGATRVVTLEDLYRDTRSRSSINAVVLDGFLSELAAIRAGEHVLDFGCGTGEQALTAAAAGASVTAYDPSEGMIAVLKDRLDERPSLKVSATSDLDGKEVRSRFDLVMCTNVLDHIGPESIRETLNALRMGLAADGRAIITVPHPVKDGAKWIRTGRDERWEYGEVRLGEYFEEGEISKHRETADGKVAKRSVKTHHRTIEAYARLFVDAGFSIAGLYEPRPPESVASEFPEIWAKTSRMPYFLTFVLHPVD